MSLRKFITYAAPLMLCSIAGSLIVDRRLLCCFLYKKDKIKTVANDIVAIEQELSTLKQDLLVLLDDLKATDKGKQGSVELMGMDDMLIIAAS